MCRLIFGLQNYKKQTTSPSPFPHKFCINTNIVNLTLKPCIIPIKAVPLPTHKPKHNKMEKQNKTQKSKTAKVAKTKERRISNKKVESLHKYWEAFPGLKRRLIQPVEGENYSLIKPKDIKNAVYANAGVKRAVEFLNAFTFNKGESLISSLNYNTDDLFPEILKRSIKNDARLVHSNMPFINLREILKGIDLYWPLAVEYQKICKDGGGIMACKKQPLFISAMKYSLTRELFGNWEDSKIPFDYYNKTYMDLLDEKAKFVFYPEGQLKYNEDIKRHLQKKLENLKQYDEIVTTEVNRRIDNLDETEIKKIVYNAFFRELSFMVQFQFQCSIYSLVRKLSA